MSGVRETYRRNLEGLNDIYFKYESDIKNSIQILIKEGKYEEALTLVDEKINFAILEFEKRKKTVRDILQTKVSISFDESDKQILNQWDNDIINAISKIEMLGSSYIQQINANITESVRIPAIESFLLEAAKKKAFTRMTFDFVAKRLNVPKAKVEEVVEDLIFDGKLTATIDQVSGTIIFSEVQSAASIPPTTEASPTTTAPLPPPPKPPPVSFQTPKQEGPQPISIDTPPPEGPQPLDFSLEPPDLPDADAELPLDPLAIPPEIVLSETETIDLSASTRPPSAPEESGVETMESQTPISKEEDNIPDEVDTQEEARSLISFFKDSIDELSEQEKEEARKKREEKKKQLEEAKRKKLEEKKQLEEPEKKDVSRVLDLATEILDSKEPELEPPASSEEYSKLVSPPASSEPKGKDILICACCKNEISKQDASIIPCPHACGAYGHKAEFLEKGSCPKCGKSIGEMDIEFSELL